VEPQQQRDRRKRDKDVKSSGEREKVIKKEDFGEVRNAPETETPGSTAPE